MLTRLSSPQARPWKRATIAAPATCPASPGRNTIARLAGQQRDYLVRSLKGFRGNTRADLDGMMSESAQPLSDKDIDDVAAWLSKL